METCARNETRATGLPRDVRKLIDERKWTQAEAARLFGVSQPRIRDLARGKIELFSIDGLVDMLARAGYRVSLAVREDRRVA